MPALSFRDRLKYRREFIAHMRAIRDEHPDWDTQAVVDEAVARMEDVYGASGDWESIIKMILEFLMAFLPLFI